MPIRSEGTPGQPAAAPVPGAARTSPVTAQARGPSCPTARLPRWEPMDRPERAGRGHVWRAGAGEPHARYRPCASGTWSRRRAGCPNRAPRCWQRARRGPGQVPLVQGKQCGVDEERGTTWVANASSAQASEGMQVNWCRDGHRVGQRRQRPRSVSGEGAFRPW